jgi:hypothetical protein
MIIGTVQALLQEETFTFTPEGETEEVHIFSGQLRKWLLANAKDKVINLTFPDGQTEEELIKQHGLEEPRMKSMTLLEASEPVIVGLWPGGTHVLIDGGHRRWFWWKRGINTIKGWAVPMDIWRCFQVSLDELSMMTHHKTGASLPQRRGK